MAAMKAKKALAAMKAKKAAKAAKIKKAVKAIKARHATKATKMMDPTEGEMASMRTACADFIDGDDDLKMMLEDHGGNVNEVIGLCTGSGEGGNDYYYGGSDPEIPSKGAVASGETFPAVGSPEYEKLAGTCSFAEGEEDLKMIFEDNGSNYQATIDWCASMAEHFTDSLLAQSATKVAHADAVGNKASQKVKATKAMAAMKANKAAKAVKIKKALKAIKARQAKKATKTMDPTEAEMASMRTACADFIDGDDDLKMMLEDHGGNVNEVIGLCTGSGE